MPVVAGRRYPYTREGIAAAEAAKERLGASGAEFALAGLADELARDEEVERLRRIASAQGSIDVGDRAFPYTPTPYRGRTAEPQTATLRAVPRDLTMYEHEDSGLLGRSYPEIVAGSSAGMVAGTALGELLVSPGPFSANPYGLAGMALGALAGPAAGWAGRKAGETYGRTQTPQHSAGRITPGPMVASEVQRGGLGGPSVSEWAVEAAAERVEQARADHDEAEMAKVLAARQQQQEYARKLAEVEVAEAARQQALQRQFGTATERAEDILALEALRGGF